MKTANVGNKINCPVTSIIKLKTNISIKRKSAKHLKEKLDVLQAKREASYLMNQLLSGLQLSTTRLWFKVIQHDDIRSCPSCFQCFLQRSTFNFNFCWKATDCSGIFHCLHKMMVAIYHSFQQLKISNRPLTLSIYAVGYKLHCSVWVTKLGYWC